MRFGIILMSMCSFGLPEALIPDDGPIEAYEILAAELRRQAPLMKCGC